MSEYDPLIPRASDSSSDDLERVQRHFAQASRNYLTSTLPWLVWALVLPSAALLTSLVAGRAGAFGVLVLWSVAVLIGGAVEATTIFGRKRRVATPLGAWAMRVQGNQSLVGLALSGLLIWRDLPLALPALWLLLIGHSFFVLGGLAFRPMRWAGVVYQLGGLVALLPAAPALWVFAAATALGNLLIAVGLARRRPGRAG